MKGPKILADIMESIAAAIYVDLKFNLKKLWKILERLLNPIVTLEDLKKHPIRKLKELCQKEGKQVEIMCKRARSKKYFASCYINGELVGSASASKLNKNIAKINATKEALSTFPQPTPANDGGRLSENVDRVDEGFEIEGADEEFHEICDPKRKWTKPIYNQLCENVDGVDDDSEIEGADEKLHKIFYQKKKWTKPNYNGRLCENVDGVDEDSEIEGADKELHENFYQKKKWTKPIYKWILLAILLAFLGNVMKD